jgi:hypothetical protein
MGAQYLDECIEPAANSHSCIPYLDRISLRTVSGYSANSNANSIHDHMND